MNATIVFSIFFLSFAVSMLAAAYVIATGKPGGVFIILAALLFFGSTSIRHTTNAECPKCGHSFQVKHKDKE